MAQARWFWEIGARAYQVFSPQLSRSAVAGLLREMRVGPIDVIWGTPTGPPTWRAALILVSVRAPSPTRAYRRAMEAAYTLDDARVLFPDLVEEARLTRRPVLITEDGEPVVAIVDVQWLEDCERLMAEQHPHLS